MLNFFSVTIFATKFELNNFVDYYRLINNNVKLHLKALEHCCKLFCASIYITLCSTDSHRSVSLKVLEGNFIRHKTLRMLKFHHITEFMKT